VGCFGVAAKSTEREPKRVCGTDTWPVRRCTDGTNRSLNCFTNPSHRIRGHEHVTWSRTDDQRDNKVKVRTLTSWLKVEFVPQSSVGGYRRKSNARPVLEMRKVHHNYENGPTEKIVAWLVAEEQRDQEISKQNCTNGWGRAALEGGARDRNPRPSVRRLRHRLSGSVRSRGGK